MLEAVNAYITRHTLGWDVESQRALVCTWCLRQCLHKTASKRDNCFVSCVDPVACEETTYGLLDASDDRARQYMQNLRGPSQHVSNNMLYRAHAQAVGMSGRGGLPANLQRTLTLVILVCAILCGFVTFGVIDRNFGRLL